ncbi:hypothetical protein OKW30_000799 [Paraburkholderia sp. Clong3]|nr:hypothetical protein [Paraburkholderia sp. CI2]
MCGAVERQGNETPAQRRLAQTQKGVATAEGDVLVELAGERQACLERIAIRRKLAAPGPIAFL